jgi:preprotein translocase subunit SecE
VKDFYIQLLIWVLVVGTIFGLLWKSGQIARFAGYVVSVREELRKCSWPTRDELVHTTVLILIVIAMMGVFTLISDFVVLRIVRTLLSV